MLMVALVSPIPGVSLLLDCELNVSEEVEVEEQEEELVPPSQSRCLLGCGDSLL